MPSEIDRRIGDRYEPTAVLGRGGMATVWRARDLRLHRDVAVKEVHLPAELDGGEAGDVRRRVEREARAAARLSHPSSVTVFDTFEEGGRLYLVMELVDAPTLHDVVTQRGPLTAVDAARIGLGVLDALEAAHEHGIVHRDVKPGNIMVLPAGGVKLADFGVASVKDHPAVTRTGQVSGSPSYMAPEQARGGESAAPADLWALGATLYFAVEGVAPFERDAAMATMLAVVNDPPRPPVRAGDLAPVLLDLLDKDPARRPVIADVRRRLRAIADANDTVVETAVAGPTTGTRAYSPPPAPPAPSTTRGRGVGIAVALVLLVALAAGLLAFAARDGGEENDGERAATPAPTTADRAPAVNPPTTDPPSTDEPVDAGDGSRPEGVPDGWVAYRDPQTGYGVWYPDDWQVAHVDGTRTDFRDPASGAYLRIDWTSEPGDSPEAAWRAQSESFGASHDNYREVRIEPTTYQGFEAAEWEYTYSEGGADLHAIDLGFVTDTHGFALNFQTREADWESSQDLFESFKDGFEPPAQ